MKFYYKNGKLWEADGPTWEDKLNQLSMFFSGIAAIYFAAHVFFWWWR